MTWMLLFAFLTVVSWGVYGVFLHKGQMGMADPNVGRYKAFLWVGVAYFLVAVLAPLVMLRLYGKSGDTNFFAYPSSGWQWSLIAGIVHFANFYRMMENTEHAFFRSIGLSVHGGGVGWPRVAAACEFFKPLRFEEIVDIQLLVAEIRNRSIRYVFRFWKNEAGGRAEIARGTVTTVCASVKDGALAAVAIPENIRALLQPAGADELP